MNKEMMAKRKKVILLGMGGYELMHESSRLEKKFCGLSKFSDVYVLSRGQGWGVNKHCALFFQHAGLPKLLLPFFLLKHFIYGWYLVSKYDIDTIITQTPSLDGFVGALIKSVTKKELIVEVHGDWINNPFLYFNIPLEKQVKKVLEILSKFAFRNADKIRVVSSAAATQVKELTGRDAGYNFLTFTDLDIFMDEKVVSYKPYVVYVGWFYKLKGVHDLIQAFQRISDQYPNASLKLIGAGPYTDELLTVAQEKPDRIEFLGKKDLAGVVEIVKDSQALVLPSYSEGLPRVLVEAAALRKVRISTCVGGIPDVITDGVDGYLVEPGDIEALSQKLAAVFADPDKARVMGEKARKMVEEKYSMEEYFQSYAKMIND